MNITSTIAIDQFGLSVKTAKLEASELFRRIANGRTSWSQLTAEEQRFIIVQEILTQTEANFGAVVDNTASRLLIFKAQTANTVMALGNIGKCIAAAVLPALTTLMGYLEKAFNFIATLFSQILSLFGITVDFISNTGSGISDGIGGAG